MENPPTKSIVIAGIKNSKLPVVSTDLLSYELAIEGFTLQDLSRTVSELIREEKIGAMDITEFKDVAPKYLITHCSV